jgi:membrane associated rhomboid family serine protease
MLIPYRVKNPVKRIPFATIIIILANIIFFAMTSHGFYHVRDDVFNSFSFALGFTPLWRFFTAIFLNGDVGQLGLNVLFLFVLGPAVEERLGVIRYIVVYLLAGMVGAVFQAGLEVAYTGNFFLWVGPNACIMGIVGAYWFVYSWSQIDVFYWFVLWTGVYEVDAFWVVGVFVVMDLVEGIIYHQIGLRGGIANVAHASGGAAAVLFCIMLRVKRDSAALSDAKAMRADELHLSNLPLHALQTMLDDNPKDLEVLGAMVLPATRQGEVVLLKEAFQKVGAYAIEKDPRLVAHYLIDLRSDPTIYNPTQLLRLAGLIERLDDPVRSMAIYRLIVDRFTTYKDCETALYRMALLSWNALKDAGAARTYIDELEWRYPHGDMIEFARVLARKLPVVETPET